MVGDPGIEPGVRLREGVTVPCHTLRPVAHLPETCSDVGLITSARAGRQQENLLQCTPVRIIEGNASKSGSE